MRPVRTPFEGAAYVRRCGRLRGRGLSESLYKNLVDAGDWDLLGSLERARASDLERLSAVETELNLSDGRPRADALLEECDRADALAGDRGGFVETKRIRELLGGEHA